MVRNAVSMQNLYTKANVNTDESCPNVQTIFRPSSSMLNRLPQADIEQQHHVRFNQPIQLHGNDDYTKWLMTRIATGQATTEEKAKWNEHVAIIKGQSTERNAVPSPTPIGWVSPEPTADLTARGIQQIEDGNSQAHADYHLQLKLLEWQSKQRLRMVRNTEGLGRSSMPLQGSNSNISGEYEYEEAETKQKKDIINNTRKYNTATVNVKSPGIADATQGRRFLLAQKEIEELGNRWATDHNPLLSKPEDEYTMEDNAEIDRLWKAHLAQRSSQKQYSRRQGKKIEQERFKQATRDNAAKYAKPFCDFMTNNPTVFHAVDAIKFQLKGCGFKELSERDSWDLEAGASYFVERNGSSLMAFTIGSKYTPGNGAAILAGHVDALCAKLKPMSEVPNKAGYLQLGVAPYAGAPNMTWWDRDLSIGGRVLVKDGDRIITKLVKLDWPIARIPTLAPHFGAASQPPFNPETQMVPIIGLESTNSRDVENEPFSQPSIVGFSGAFPYTSTWICKQPPKLVKAIGDAIGLTAGTYSKILNWELELYDTQPATLGGLDKEFIFAGCIDDKLCSWAAIQALIEAGQSGDTEESSLIKLVGLFDDEEIGSGLRQGARSNFLPLVLERIVGSFSDGKSSASELMGRTYANSFLLSSDVIHAVNPNFLDSYLENHSPHLNVGLAISADPNGHMTTDSSSIAVLQRCADKIGAKLQVFQIRNDSRSGGTVGPVLSSMTGIRAIDAGIPQLSMHSIRATTGSLDPGLGVLMFRGFLNGFESVDKEFR